MNGFQVLWRHDILVFDVELVARIAVGDGVATAAYLSASATIGTGAGLVKAQVALAGDGHAKSTVAEHLDAHRFAMRAAYSLAEDGLVYIVDLLEIDLAGKHHNVGKLTVESHRLAVRHIHLSGDVHLHTYLTGIENGSHIAGNDSRDVGFFGGIDDAAHKIHITVEHHGIHRQVALHATFTAPCGYLMKVVDSEIVRRLGSHIQALDAEIYSIGAALMCSHKRLIRAHRRHYLKVFSVHIAQFFGKDSAN